MNDPLGAFCRHTDVTLPGAKGGPLAGLRFALKDIYDVAGHVTGCGNPDWLATHAPAQRTAPVVEALLASGAAMVGKTITDELAYSLAGQNFHYGTPANSAAPGRIPGGSSSGSAAAVAGGVVDFSIGSDTGGSVRVPASLCGIYGIRTTHGRLSLDGVMPLAPGFDTVGWFARDADLLARVGEVLLGSSRGGGARKRLLIASDAFALADPAVQEVLRSAVARVAAAFSERESVAVGAEGGGLESWMACFRTLQAREIWAAHGAWVEATKPSFGPDVAGRFAFAKSVAQSPAGDEAARREGFAERMKQLLRDGAVLCLPSAPSIAPLIGSPPDALQSYRDRTLSLTCIAGLARLPQVSMPAGLVDGCPVGLSLVMAGGADRELLSIVRDLAPRIGARAAAS